MRLPALLAALLATASAQEPPPKPNIVILYADDLGYGDLACYGHPTIQTPNLDRMAAEGLRLTSFYAAMGCSPARAMILTGRYPTRTGVYRVYGPDDAEGLPASEITLGEALQKGQTDAQTADGAQERSSPRANSLTLHSAPPTGPRCRNSGLATTLINSSLIDSPSSALARCRRLISASSRSSMSRPRPNSARCRA